MNASNNTNNCKLKNELKNGILNVRVRRECFRFIF